MIEDGKENYCGINEMNFENKYEGRLFMLIYVFLSGLDIIICFF